MWQTLTSWILIQMVLVMPVNNKLFISLILLLVTLVTGCEGPDLERIQVRQKVSLSGSFLTQSPDEIVFPVKILFAIDCSLSMGDEIQGVEAGSDPQFLRIEAVRNFIDEYNSNENVSFDILLWSADVFDMTRDVDGNGGFTKDVDELNRVLDGAYNDTTTDYLGTLETVHTHIRNDINKEENASDLSRSKYVVVFLSDGLSNTGDGLQSDFDIWQSVEDIAETTEEADVGSFSVNTFLLLGGFGLTDSGQQAREIAETTLTGMADSGDGQFRLFETAESIDFISVIDLRLTVEYIVKYMVAYNYNVQAGIELVHVDSDGDGLTNDEEMLYGTDALIADTDDDGLSDYFEIRSSSPTNILDPLVQDSPCDKAMGDEWVDTDLDGLTDCEEFVKGTFRKIPDSDGDGIPDGIEFLTGANPLNDQIDGDQDFDGVVDWLEIQKHTNLKSTDPKIQENYSYNYTVLDMGLVEQFEQGQVLPSYVRQFDFNISNIDVMDTTLEIPEESTEEVALVDEDGNPIEIDPLPSYDHVTPGDNLIRFFIAQVPEDKPDDTPIFMMAEQIVNFSEGERDIVFGPGDFQLIQ